MITQIKWNLSLLSISLMVVSLYSCGNSRSDTAKDKGVDTTTTSTVTPEPSIKEEAVNYEVDGVTMKSYIAYNKSQPGRRPIVLVLPEWWGLTEYPRMRAKMLAEMGYIAMAVDMYGDGKLAENPDEAGKAATPFYQNPAFAKQRMDAALAKAKTFEQADTSKVLAIGYCFGGSMVLNYAKMGSPVLGVVSFHGGLEGVPPQKGTTASFLVCHGGADDFVPQSQVTAFRKSMDSAGLKYDFKTYEGATHAFTNPNATEKGKAFNMPIRYNGAADTASWNDMKTFFTSLLQ